MKWLSLTASAARRVASRRSLDIIARWIADGETPQKITGNILRAHRPSMANPTRHPISAVTLYHVSQRRNIITGFFWRYAFANVIHFGLAEVRNFSATYLAYTHTHKQLIISNVSSRSLHRARPVTWPVIIRRRRRSSCAFYFSDKSKFFCFSPSVWSIVISNLPKVLSL